MSGAAASSTAGATEVTEASANASTGGASQHATSASGANASTGGASQHAASASGVAAEAAQAANIKQAFLEARVRMDDVLCLFEGYPGPNFPMPPRLSAATVEKGALFVLPPSLNRGDVRWSQKRIPNVVAFYTLAWAGRNDFVAISLGEDESLRNPLKEALVGAFPNLGEYSWNHRLVPVVQDGKNGDRGLIEYLLVGAGANHAGKVSKIQWRGAPIPPPRRTGLTTSPAH